MNISNQHAVHFISKKYLSWKIHQTWLPLEGTWQYRDFPCNGSCCPSPKKWVFGTNSGAFFFFLELWTSLQSYRCPQAQSSSWLPNLQPESSGWYGLVPQVVKHSKRLHPAALSWSLQTLSIQESSPAAHHLSRLQGHLSRVEININASFLGYLSSKSPKFLNSLCCNSILSRSSFSSFSHSAFFFDHLSSISS